MEQVDINCDVLQNACKDMVNWKEINTDYTFSGVYLCFFEKILYYIVYFLNTKTIKLHFHYVLRDTSISAHISLYY